MKVRRIDYYPDEYIAGVGNVLRADEQGVYWMICSLIMSEGGPIENNDRRIAGLCGIRPAGARKIIEKLVALGKLQATNDGKLSQKRAQSEVERSSKRIQSAHENGAKGGRPRQNNEQNQTSRQAAGFLPEKLTNNYQLTTNNQEKEMPASAGPDPDHRAAAPPDPTKAERELFERGKQILGKSAGGMIRKLLAAKGGSVPLARAAIEQAATKHDAREYVGRILAGHDPPPGAGGKVLVAI